MPLQFLLTTAWPESESPVYGAFPSAFFVFKSLNISKFYTIILYSYIELPGLPGMGLTLFQECQPLRTVSPVPG